MSGASAVSFYSGPIKARQRPDRQFVRDLADRFAEPSRDETARVFADQIVRVAGLHRCRPSERVRYVERYRGDPMKSANETITRTIRECEPSLNDKRVLTKEVAAALKRDFRHKHSHMKVIARHAEASPRTVEAWTDGLNLPGFDYIARLAPHSPSIRKLLMRLATLDGDTDPEYGRTLSDLRQAAERTQR